MTAGKVISMNPKISMIVPIYGVEKYLDRCMQSLFAQTETNIEMILVDDGSPDNCPAMCDAYAQQDKRVRVIHKQNAGLGMARNSGIEAAAGEYIAFVDSDDYVSSDMCEKLYAAAKRYDADIVCGDLYYDHGSRGMKTKPMPEKEIVRRGQEEIRAFLLDLVGTKPENARDQIMEIGVWRNLYRRTLFSECGIRFVSERTFIAEDLIYDIDCYSRANCVVTIPERVYYYCSNEDSLSKKHRSDRFAREKILFAEVRRKLEQLQFPEADSTRACDRMVLSRTRTCIRHIAKSKKSIGGAAARRELREICNDADFRAVLGRYPLLRLPWKYAFAALLMKYRVYWLLLWILR